MHTMTRCTDPRCRCPAHGRRPPRRADEAFELSFEVDEEVDRSSSSYVRWVQSSLNRLIGAGLVVDGISGTLTRAAVRSFQQRQGLAVDGIVGPVTEAALLRAGASPVPGGTPVPAPAPVPAPSTGSLLAVPESAIVAGLAAFVPYRYGHDARYPRPVPGVNVNTGSGAKLIDCCTFVEGLLLPAWGDVHGSRLGWNLARHNQMMIINDGSDYYSPVTAVVAAGMGRAVTAPGPWCVVQGWKSGYTGGHTFIVVAHHAASDRVLTLEANIASTGLDGVGCYGFGPLRDMPGQRPPVRWWEDARAPTWSAIRGRFTQGVKLAQLAVTRPVWPGF